MGQVTRTIFGCSKILQFTDAEIKQLPVSSPVTLISAIPNAVILPVIVSFTLTPWVADYTNIDVTSNFGVNINSVYTIPTLTGGGVLAQGHANLVWGDYGREYDFTPKDLGSLINKPLELVVTNGALGAFTGGDPSTVLIVQVFYNVLRYAPELVA